MINKVLRLSCVGLPDKESGDYIWGLTKKLSAKTGSVKTLNYFPHFSLRNDFEIQEEKLSSLVTDLEVLSKTSVSLKFSVNYFGFYQWKIIYLEVPLIPELSNLHQDCMAIIQKYRTPWVAEELQKNSTYVGKQRDYINKYGYQFSFEYYSPHFTLAGPDMSEEVFAKTKAELINKTEKIDVFVSEFALVDWGDSGRILAKFKLSAKN